MRMLTAEEFAEQGTSPWAVISMAVYHERRVSEIREAAADMRLDMTRHIERHRDIADWLRFVAGQMDVATTLGHRQRKRAA